RSEVQCEQSRGCQFGFLGSRSQNSGEGGRGIYSANPMNGFPKIMVLLVLWTSGSVAQNRQLLYDFQEVPQSLMLNPGMKVSQNWHAGIPVLSGLYFQASTSGVTVNDLFADDGVDFTTKVRERAIQAMGRRDDFGSTSQIEGF